LGFSYRKSVKVGPFRMTASKSGISYSVGVKGARVTKRANRRVQTTLSVPGTGIRYTAQGAPAARPAQRPSAPNALPPQYFVPAQIPAKPKTPGRWYFWLAALSCGVLAFVPFVHAWVELKRDDLRNRAAVFLAGSAIIVVLALLTPTDAQGNATGTAGSVLSAVEGTLALATALVSCLLLIPVRREVFGLQQSPRPVSDEGAVADPAVQAALAARGKRSEARALAQRDRTLALDLQVGRPDLQDRSYDDGGLVDLNRVPAVYIAATTGIDQQSAERLVQTRERINGFTTVDEAVVYAELTGTETERIRDRGLVIPL
jgi:hypothetical protein